MTESHEKINRIRMTIFLCFLLVSALTVIGTISYIKKKENIQHARYVMQGEINKLQYTIDSRLLNAEILEMIIVNDNGTVKNFDNIAKKLFKTDPSIRSLQLAPDGVVSYVYPLEGNEEAFGDLFSDPDRKTEAEYARDTGNMTLAGPYELSQGGMGVVARRPIYLTDDEGKETFWGFSIVILNVPEIFDTADLKSLFHQGYYYRIWRTHPDTHDIQVITENTSKEFTNPVEDEMTVPGGIWTLSLMPKDGWIPLEYLLIESGISLVIIFLLMLICYSMLTIFHQKKILSLQANTDPITGLNNERCFTTLVKKLTAEKTPFVLFYLDLDKFKQVNDQFGHDVGDKYLIESAVRIRSCIREKDLAFRIGGDEFTIVVISHFNKESSSNLKQRIKTLVSQPFIFDETTLYPEISIGCAGYPDEESDLEALIRLADQRMYAEKKFPVSE